MEQTYITIAMVTIGVGAVATGIVGVVALPRGEQLSALLALVVGAGIGIASLFLMMNSASDVEAEDSARMFMIASFLGLAGVATTLTLLTVRTRAGKRPEAPATTSPPPAGTGSAPA